MATKRADPALVERWRRRPWTVDASYDPDEERYRARVVELDGCEASGSTRLEALDRLEHSLADWLDSALLEGRFVPEPLAERDFSGRLSLRISPTIHKELTALAERERVSLNNLLATTLAQRVGRGPFSAASVDADVVTDEDLSQAIQRTEESIPLAKRAAYALERHGLPRVALLVRALLTDRVLHGQSPTESSRHLGRTARMAADHGLDGLAEALWVESLELDDTNRVSHEALAGFLFEHGRFTEAVPYLRESTHRSAQLRLAVSEFAMHSAQGQPPDDQLEIVVKELRDFATGRAREVDRAEWLRCLRALASLRAVPDAVLSNLVEYANTHARWRKISDVR